MVSIFSTKLRPLYFRQARETRDIPYIHAQQQQKRDGGVWYSPSQAPIKQLDKAVIHHAWIRRTLMMLPAAACAPGRGCKRCLGSLHVLCRLHG